MARRDKRWAGPDRLFAGRNTKLPGSTSDEHDIELKRIYALSRFHGCGIGLALMQQAVELAEKQGRRRLLLGVYAGNTRARAFYSKTGFAQIAERSFRVGDREYDDVVLAKQLAPNLPYCDGGFR